MPLAGNGYSCPALQGRRNSPGTPRGVFLVAMNRLPPSSRQRLAWAAAVMLLTCIPYIVVWFPTPRDAVFPWVLFNSDDHGVYFAWMRQAADGEWLFRNLFTTEAQRGIYPHAYFLLLGRVSRWTGVDLPVVYHIGRVVCGIGVLVLAGRLAERALENRLAASCAFWMAGLSSGLGWLFWRDREIQQAPVDVWQPEAVTFASLYTNGLFAVSLLLVLLFIHRMLDAEERGIRPALCAGAALLALGNIHTYDVVPLVLAGAIYCLLKAVDGRSLPLRLAALWLIAGLVALPSVAYMAWLYATEPVFRARADTATLSPALWRYVMGYGLLAPLAGLGLWAFRPGAATTAEARSTRMLMLAWLIACPVCAYLPVAFQRKMIMGFHLPLAILAGGGAAWLATRVAGRLPRVPHAAGVTAALLVGATIPSSLLFLVRDVRLAFADGITSTGVHPVYWPQSDWEAARRLRREADSAVLYAFPLNAVMLPAWSGRTVLAGHWGETPAWTARVQEGFRFFSGDWDSRRREEYLRSNGVTHVLHGPVEARLARNATMDLGREEFLEPVFRSGATTLYRVLPATGRPAGGRVSPPETAN